jgi:glycerol-3-phosphate acyltransferase PlsY
MTTSLAWSAAAFALGYLLGAIPFGLLLTRIAGTQDLRTIGSGNIGATNVLRTGRKGLAAVTLICDALKGTAAVLIANKFGGLELALVAAAGAFLGHLFPIWLRFKGGKGVATYIGLLIGLAWPAAIFFCLVWAVAAAISRYSSLSALISSALTPAFVWYASTPITTVLFLALSALLWIKHRANIVRLLAGTEEKIGGTKVPKENISDGTAP